MTPQNPALKPPQPWWTFGHVWLVLAGPVLVVVASFVTFYLAANGQDPVLTGRHDPVVEAAAAQGSGALAPAMQARNHAATGGTQPLPTPNKP